MQTIRTCSFRSKERKYDSNAASETPQCEVVYAMVFQVAEGPGIALLAREEMLIDAQHPRAQRRMVLARATASVGID